MVLAVVLAVLVIAVAVVVLAVVVLAVVVHAVEDSWIWSLSLDVVGGVVSVSSESSFIELCCCSCSCCCGSCCWMECAPILVIEIPLCLGGRDKFLCDAVVVVRWGALCFF